MADTAATMSAVPDRTSVDELRLRRGRSRLLRYALYGLLLLIAGLCFNTTIIEDTDWERIGSLGSVLRAVGRYVGIDTALVPQLLEPMLETMMMASLGTLLAMLLSLPVIWFGALNLTPSKLLLYPVARFIMTLSRSIHEIVWALVFVAAVGLGSLAGILAIGLRSIAFIAKMTAEAIENVDPRPIEAIRAMGGNQIQVVIYGIVPQILPTFLGTVIFEWDFNIRRSAIMGLVGAGGLGLAFHRQMVMFNYPGVTTVIGAILVLIALAEVVSHHARKAVT